METVGYFDAEAGGWSDRYRCNRHFKTRLDTVFGWIQAHGGPGLSILDYGCGSGVLLKTLAEAGHSVTGVDASPGMLAEARHACQGLPVTLEPVGEDLNMPALQQDYDGVTCLGVLEYLEDPQALLARLADVVKPGGFLTLSVPNRASWLRRAERWVFRHPGPFRALGLLPHLTRSDSYLQFQRHQFEVSGLARELQGHGFRLNRLRYHVAPRMLSPVEGIQAVGMTAIAEFVKTPS